MATKFLITLFYFFVSCVFLYALVFMFDYFILKYGARKSLDDAETVIAIFIPVALVEYIILHGIV